VSIRFLVARELLSKFDMEVRVMKFNATFKNISVISWRSGLLVEEARVPGKTTDLLEEARVPGKTTDLLQVN